MNAAAMMAENKLSVLGTMMAKITWPAPLTDSLHIAYLEPVNLPAAAALLFLVGFIAIMGGRWARIGLMFFCLALVPGLTAVASRFLIGERYLAMPIVGLAIAFAAIAPRSPKLAWLLILMAPWGWTSHQRIADWNSDLSLAQSAHNAHQSPYTASWYGHELGQNNQPRPAIQLLDYATSSEPPTCDFSADWIRLELNTNGAPAAIETAMKIWNRRCAGAPGVRGIWAQSLLENRDTEGASAILTPRPDPCTASLAIPTVSLHLIENQSGPAKRCAAESGLPLSVIQPEVNRLIAHLSRAQTNEEALPAPPP